MNVTEIKAFLDSTPKSIKDIEEELGMPKTTLQKAAKGERSLPKKWAIALREYASVDSKELQKEEPKSPQPQKNNPTTLEDIKAMCPKELSGFERSAWIGTERQKYGI